MDDKKLVVADIVVLIKYIQGDKKLEYQANNIVNNYKNKRCGYKCQKKNYQSFTG